MKDNKRVNAVKDNKGHMISIQANLGLLFSVFVGFELCFLSLFQSFMPIILHIQI